MQYWITPYMDKLKAVVEKAKHIKFKHKIKEKEKNTYTNVVWLHQTSNLTSCANLHSPLRNVVSFESKPNSPITLSCSQQTHTTRL